MPVFGALFGSREHRRDGEELLVVVTLSVLGAGAD